MEQVEEYQRQIVELVGQAYSLDEGSVKVALFEQCVQLADAHNDIDAGFALRKKLVDAGNWGGHPEVSLVHFAWRLAQADRDPERFPEHTLLWEYKWVVVNLPDFPHIQRAQMESAFADMEVRFRRNGSTLYALHHLRRRVAMISGDYDSAQAAHTLLRKASRDWLSDCAACVLNEDIQYHVMFGRNARAVQCAEPILSGRSTCKEIPHRTYGELLLPLALLGRMEEAAECHRKGYRLAANNPNFIDTVAQHLVFAGLNDELPKALRMIAKHLPIALAMKAPLWRFHFLRAVRFIFAQFASRGKSTVKLRLPESVPLYDASGSYSVDALLAWSIHETDSLAALFDQRNGNTYLRDGIQSLDELPRRVAKAGASKG